MQNSNNGSTYSQSIEALAAIADKRRSRPQLERARLVFAQLAPFRTNQNTNAFEEVSMALDEAGDAMDNLECADTSDEKTMWREDADAAWDLFGSAVEELAEEIAA